MPVSPLDLSIVIVTYNSIDVISPCLDSIAAHHSPLAVETIIIDNGSNDGTCDLIDRTYPWVNLITMNDNIGFAAANNLGFATSHGRSFLMLNPDTEVHPGALQAMLAYADTHHHVGMIAPRVINMDGSLQHSTFRFPNIRQAIYGFFERLVPIDSIANGRYAPAEYEYERSVDHILGAAILVKRSLWEQIDGMDERYALYFEETDWCYRAQMAGWTLRYIPTATIMHRGAHTTSNIPEISSVLFARSQARFYRKNLGLPQYLLLKLIAYFGISYWLARSLSSLLRYRISTKLFIKRARSYWKIILA